MRDRFCGGNSKGRLRVGTDENDLLNGGRGNDTIDGGLGSDSLFGLVGDDLLIGGRRDPDDPPGSGDGGGDLLVGGLGDDTLDGRPDFPPTQVDPDVDTLIGGLGNDVYYVNNLSDVLHDAGGVDTVVAGVDWTLGASFENMRFEGDEGWVGIGNRLDNEISGAFSVRIEGRGGDDTLSGSSNATLLGGRGDDTILGGQISHMFGEAGDDLLVSTAELGFMDGGKGNDTLVASAGEDAFLFTVAAGPRNADLVRGFESGQDALRFENAVFRALGAEGEWAADDPRFHAAAGARRGDDPDDRLVYDTDSGKLFYDADGSGCAAARLVATLDAAPALAASDIVIV